MLSHMAGLTSLSDLCNIPPTPLIFLIHSFIKRHWFHILTAKGKKRGYKTHCKILILILGVSIQKRIPCFVFYMMVTILAGRQAGIRWHLIVVWFTFSGWLVYWAAFHVLVGHLFMPFGEMSAQVWDDVEMWRTDIAEVSSFAGPM